MTDNPYQAPQTELLIDNSEGVTRYGKKIFVPLGSELPHRCVKCNAEASLPLITVKSYSHSMFPLVFLVVGFGIMYALNVHMFSGILILVTVILERTFQVNYATSVGLCEKHYRRRLLGRVIFFGVFILSLMSFILLMVDNSLQTVPAILIKICFVGIVMSLLGFGLSSRLVRISALKDKGPFVKGTGKIFLESFTNQK